MYGGAHGSFGDRRCNSYAKISIWNVFQVYHNYSPFMFSVERNSTVVLN